MKRPMRVRIEGILKTQTGGDIRHEARGSAGPTRAYGGDWFRRGTFELRSRSWSPRHVKQGYRQVNWQKEHSERSGARHGCLINAARQPRDVPDSGATSFQGTATRHVVRMALAKIERARIAYACPRAAAIRILTAE